MYETENDIPEQRRSELNALMNQRLADAVDLQMQMKQAHWNVKGPHFIGLHELFDKIDEAVEAYVDLIAERIVQLGGIAEGTARVAAERYGHVDDIAAMVAFVGCVLYHRVELDGRWRHERLIAALIVSKY